MRSKVRPRGRQMRSKKKGRPVRKGSKKSMAKLSETLSLSSASSVIAPPKKSKKGNRPVVHVESSSGPVKSKKKKSKKTKAWHSKIHGKGKKGKKGKKKKHKKKKMKGGAAATEEELAEIAKLHKQLEEARKKDPQI